MSVYLESVKKQFVYYQKIGEQAILQIDPRHLNERISEESNSLADMVKHLKGNMLSRWTDFLKSDGEKEWRQRDAEFEGEYTSHEAMLADYDDGWDCLLNALNKLSADDLEKIIYIRNEGHRVIDAINRQLAHYGYHVGQIVFLARYFVGEKWRSLSIPKGESEAYNQEKFAKKKQIKHFTDDENR